MPRENIEPSDPVDPAHQGATGRNKQKNAPDFTDHYPFFDNELTPKQLAAIDLLLRGYSDAQAAEQLGVDRGTIYRWRTNDDEFIDMLDNQRRLAWQRSAQRLQSLYQPALDILEKQTDRRRRAAGAASGGVAAARRHPRAPRPPRPRRRRLAAAAVVVAADTHYKKLQRPPVRR